MCFLFLVLKAQRLKRKLKTYIRYKTISYEESTGKATIEPTFWEKLHFWWLRQCPLFLGGSKGQYGKKMTKCEQLQVKLMTDGTYENFVLKSAIGFISGVCITFLFFIFFILQLNFTLSSATIICSIFGILFTLGLAFSRRFRCIVLMLIPQLFSKTGRQALIAYAFILVLSGPAKNTLHNVRVLSESMVCEQEKLKKAIKTVFEMVKKPFHAIKLSLKQIMDKVEGTLIKIKYLLSTINKTILELLGVIKSAYSWLNSIAGMCNKKMGTPYERCNKALETAVQDCKIKLNPSMHFMCSVTYLSSPVCYSVKFIDYICGGFEYVSDELVELTMRRLNEFSHHVKNIFYVSVDFKHKLDYEGTPSKNITDITSGIAGEIRARTSAIMALFDWMSIAFSIFFLYTIIQIYKYRSNFLLKEWYDNRFITDNFIQIDIKRVYMGKEAVLPLTMHEKQKYIRINSLRLVENERKQLVRTTIYLFLSTIKLSIHILADYSLYWILSMVRYHGQFETGYDAPPEIQVNVNGKGIMADMFLSIVKAFQPENVQIDDNRTCLPQPKHPDMAIYKQIVSLIILCWILSILEAYGLRMRNWVMCYYYPAASQRRAVWLYNHINRRRSTFLKQIRRQLRKKFGLNYKSEELSFSDKFKYRCPVLARWFGLKQPEACLVCGSINHPNEPLIQCEKKNCPGIYCNQCFNDLKNICTICQLPINYGDLSDISEEVDSSDQDNYDIPIKKLKHEKVNLNHSTDTESEDRLDYSYQKLKRDPMDKPKLDPYDNTENNYISDKVNVDDIFQHSRSEKIMMKKREDEKSSRNLFQEKMSGMFEIFPRLTNLKNFVSKSQDKKEYKSDQIAMSLRIKNDSNLSENNDFEYKQMVVEKCMKRMNILSLLAPSVENTAVDLTKVDISVQTESKKPFSYARIRSKKKRKSIKTHSKVKYLKLKLFDQSSIESSIDLLDKKRKYKRKKINKDKLKSCKDKEIEYEKVCDLREPKIWSKLVTGWLETNKGKMSGYEKIEEQCIDESISSNSSNYEEPKPGPSSR